MQTSLFDVVTPENSRLLTLNDNLGIAPSVQWVVAKGPKALFYAVHAYCKQHRLPLNRVGYSSRPLT